MRSPVDDGTILLTGASSGIGREMALQLAPRARRLVLVARRVERLEALAEELRALHPSLQITVHPADLCDRGQVMALADAMLAAPETVDVLINNAGIGDHGPFAEADLEKLERMITLNLLTPTLLTRRLVEPMLAQGRGGILNISSGLGLVSLPGFAVYAGTKHYLTAFTEALAGELNPQGLHITQVCPGPVKTEFAQVGGLDEGLTDQLPGFAWLDSATCARQALAAFDRNQPLVVPGLTMKAALSVGQNLPRWIYRRIGGRITLGGLG